MNDEQTSVSVAETDATPASPEPATLERVYEEFKIEDAASRFKAEEFKPVQPAMAGDGQDVFKTLNDVTHAVNELRAERYQSSVKSDIASAVSAVEKETGLNPRLIETHLDLLARDDSRFKQVWENRHSNPKAFNAALKAAASEMAQTYQVRADSDLLANQKAMRAYQSGSATKQSSSDGKWDNLSPRQFEQQWNNIQ